MSLRGKLFAVTYDRNMARVEKAGLRALRQSLLAVADGNVFEIGGGTGANLPFYRPEVESLTITEPETPMVRRLERRVREQAPRTKVLRAPAEDLPFEDCTFDARGVYLGALRSERPATGAASASPGAAPRRAAALHRARPLRRCPARSPAGPHELVEPVDGVLRLQPADAHFHPGGGIHCRPSRAPHLAEGPVLREPTRSRKCNGANRCR